VKRSKLSNNHRKHHRGPKARRWVRRKESQPKRRKVKVGGAGRARDRKSHKYQAPESGFKWRP
jgi:hypothetical protein